MRNSLFLVGLLSVPCAAAAAPALTVRAVPADASWKTLSEPDWSARVIAEVAAAAKDGADAVVFPEGFTAGRMPENMFEGVKAAAGPDRLVVFGNAPHAEPGKPDQTSRAYVYAAGAWTPLDKLDPTAAEREAKPPTRAGMRLVLFRFRGGLAVALPSTSIQKPEIATSLKKRGAQLVLVTAPAEDEEGRARIERCASARAVELGAAVVVVTPSGPPALYLPAQKGFDLKAPAPAGRDARVPWKKLIELRATGGTNEPRPFLEPSPAYQIEI